MRTTKRFTPGVLARFAKQNRGEGVFENYRPWHQVTRGDPSSLGRSHLLQWRGRHIDLLSDGELVAALFSMQVPDVIDIREQFPIQLEEGSHELAPYLHHTTDHLFPGTISLAEQLNIRHPTLSNSAGRVAWVMTTDLLLAINHDQIQLCAVSCKPDAKLTRRSKELLSLEQLYWQIRGVRWLLITPQVYDPRVALSLRRIVPWILGTSVLNTHLEIATKIAFSMAGLPRNQVLIRVCQEVGSMDLGQRTFWQAVFKGYIPMDLSVGWRPYEELRLLSNDDFWAQNPVVAGRSAWN